MFYHIHYNNSQHCQHNGITQVGSCWFLIRILYTVPISLWWEAQFNMDKLYWQAGAKLCKTFSTNFYSAHYFVYIDVSPHNYNIAPATQPSSPYLPTIPALVWLMTTTSTEPGPLIQAVFFPTYSRTLYTGNSENHRKSGWMFTKYHWIWQVTLRIQLKLPNAMKLRR